MISPETRDAQEQTSEHQIIATLKAVELGPTVTDGSEASYHQWESKYSGMGAAQRRPR